MPEVKSPHEFDSIIEVALYFSDEKICLEYVEAAIWNNDVRCPDCKSNSVYRFKDGKKLKCSKCGRHFTLLIGTIFEASKIKLAKWIMAIYLMGANKKGINACALGRQIKVNRKTAWFMLHRIRKALEDTDTKLSGIVQSDEAFCGGRNKNRHVDKKHGFVRGRDFPKKIPVLGMLEQGGRVKAIALQSIATKYIHREVLENLEAGSILVSDEYSAYKTLLDRYYELHKVNHDRLRFVSDEGFTTNGIENFWSHLKNMIRGVYIKVTRKHIQKYLDELCFRWNTMKMSCGERLFAIFKRLNCRLTYKQLIQKT